MVNADIRKDHKSAVLQILATTDLHMQILPYDYFADQPDLRAGLVQLADQITALQADPAALTLLFDNGDFLQGNPLADTIAAKAPLKVPHAIMQAFATLRYDAVGLGNHEFNYGLPFLHGVVQQAPCPVVCANIDWQGHPACAQPFALLDRSIRCADGTDIAIRIGVVGFVPPQVADWDRLILNNMVTTRDIVTAALDIIPRMKVAGADIIVALCHAGVGASDHTPGMENAAVPLAAIPGIDVIVTGHTHDLFPDPARPPAAHMDPVAGRLHGKPAVGAGFHGHALGVIRLDLRHMADGWHIMRHTSRTVPASSQPAQGKASRQISTAVQADHAATLVLIRQPIAQTKVPIHSFFARVSLDLPTQILGAALIRHAGLERPDLDLPVIAAVAPLRAGGQAGPGHYVHIAPGPITRRDVSAIYPFADTPVLLHQTGQQVHDWLEQAVSGYNRILPQQADQPLFHPCFAPYVFDVICGLSYTIDLSQPARHDVAGKVIAPNASRIRDLRYQGRAVQAFDVFLMVSNSYRAFGGGGYPAAMPQDVLHLSPTPLRDILTDWISDQQILDRQSQPAWRFASITQASALFRSASAARRYISGNITHAGAAPDGFDRYRLMF